MKLIVKRGTTSFVCHAFIADYTVSTGAGKTGLVYNTSGLTCYYMRAGENAAVSCTIGNISTLGTYAGGSTALGFKEVDATHMPGVYELHIPNNALASGSTSAAVMIHGAADAAPCTIEFQLVAYDPMDATALGLSHIDAAITTRSTLDQTAVQGAVAAELDVAGSELSAVPSTTGTIRQKLNWLFEYFRNKRTVTNTTETLFKEDAATTLGTSSLTDDGTTFTKGEMG